MIISHLFKIGKRKVDALVDGDFEPLIVNHSPITFVAVLIHGNVRP